MCYQNFWSMVSNYLAPFPSFAHTWDVQSFLLYLFDRYDGQNLSAKFLFRRKWNWDVDCGLMCRFTLVNGVWWLHGAQDMTWDDPRPSLGTRKLPTTVADRSDVRLRRGLLSGLSVWFPQTDSHCHHLEHPLCFQVLYLLKCYVRLQEQISSIFFLLLICELES